MKKVFRFLSVVSIVSMVSIAIACAQEQPKSTVYFTSDISPEGLVKVYEALGVTPEGRVCIKISTGEENNPNYLQPSLIKNLVEKVDGTIVECCTAYGGARSTIESHQRVIKKHGFDIFRVDLMDETGDIKIPVQDSTWIHYDRVGDHIQNYDFMINLAHFKGHPMGGFGGVMKNASIGVASANGKAYIHTAGYTDQLQGMWNHTKNQDGFLESMAAAAQAVHNYFGGKVIYIDVMNNMSVDCDCVDHPAGVEVKDVGILASLDPVALDQACVDIVFGYDSKEGDNAEPLQKRIDSRHGIHIIEHAEKIGLGNRQYNLVKLDE